MNEYWTAPALYSDKTLLMHGDECVGEFCGENHKDHAEKCAETLNADYELEHDLGEPVA